MGRPFADEVSELEETHLRACAAPVDSLGKSIQRLLPYPLLAVGSGGSLTTAAIAATLFRDMAHGLSSAITPLELANRRAVLRNSSVLIATAGGSNPDAIGAVRTAAQNEAKHVMALCTRARSKLSVDAVRFSNVSVEEFECADENDGFLATNSLWASAIGLLRGFSAATAHPLKLSSRLSRIVKRSSWSTFINSVCTDALPLWNRETTIVLYGAASFPAAIDLESKLIEAALSNVWISDYRHFAHGRHHWLAKRGAQSSVIAFVSESESGLANRTLDEIPADVPQLRIEIPDVPTAFLTALAYVFPIVLSAGIVRGIDPGRPGVPAFGRRIYNLNAYGKLASKQIAKPDIESIAIKRKTSRLIENVESNGELDIWRNAYQDFLSRLEATQYDALVFDYDGTLCGPAERFTRLRSEVSAELSRLLGAGVRIGIATGRGRSVRQALRETIEKQYWPQIEVGYYNGGQIGLLNEDDIPNGMPQVNESLVPVMEALKSDSRLSQLATIEGRMTQITITAKHPQLVEECWEVAVHRANLTSPGKVKLVRSSHSFDLLPATVSKLHVIQQMRSNEAEVLAIGDMGKWPGNDCELLSHPFSLSVDQVSPDPSTCWNLALPGVSGVDAVINYFRFMKVNKNRRIQVRFSNSHWGRR